jgi:hypothetical protein
VFASIIGTAISSGTGTFRARDLQASTLVYFSGETDTQFIGEVQRLQGVQSVIPVLTLPQSETETETRALGWVTDADWALLGGPSSYVNGSGYVAFDLNELSYGYLEPIVTPTDAEQSGVDGGAFGVSIGSSQIEEVVVLTDGRQESIERVRTFLQVTASAPPGAIFTIGELRAAQDSFFGLLGRMVDVGIILCLVIAGCSLAVSVAGGLVERRRAFALLRLTGMPLRRLYRAVLLEAAVPLVLAAVTSAAVGFFVSALIIWNTGGELSIAAPGLSYFGLVAGGLVAALAIVGATLPLVGRMTEPQSVRME